MTEILYEIIGQPVPGYEPIYQIMTYGLLIFGLFSIRSIFDSFFSIFKKGG